MMPREPDHAERLWDGLPEDLAAIERRLSARRHLRLEGLRRRTAATVARELRLERSRFVWRAAGWAAAAVLILNLSLSATSSVDALPQREATTTETTVERVQALLPELSHREAVAASVLLTHGAALTPRPPLYGEKDS